MHHRQDIRTDLIRRLKNGTSLQLLGPRRVGKTWILEHLLSKDLKKLGWHAILHDVQGLNSTDAFLDGLCKKLQTLNDLPRQYYDRFIQRVDQAVSGNWKDNPIHAIARVDPYAFLERLLGDLNEYKQDTVILVDEIAIFVLLLGNESEKEVYNFLYFLRRMRSDFPYVRWIFTGSIGLDVIARRANLQGAMVGMDRVMVEPFTRDEAHSYLAELVRTGQLKTAFSINDGPFDYLVEELGWLSPHYIRLVGDRLEPTGPVAEGGNPTATKNDVEAAFNKLLKPDQRGAFCVWEEHIDKNFDAEDGKLLHAILDRCCKTTKGASETALLKALSTHSSTISKPQLTDLLAVLAMAGMLEKTNGCWRFCSGLFRRYWKEYWCE